MINISCCDDIFSNVAFFSILARAAMGSENSRGGVQFPTGGNYSNSMESVAARERRWVTANGSADSV